MLGGIGVVIIAGIAVALLFGGPAETQGVDPKGCVMPRGKARATAFVELPARVGARDSIVTARVCLTMRDPKVRIGSYHGLVTWDSTKASLVKVEKGRQGMRIENTTKGGAVDFAGAFPAGFDDRAAFTLRLRLAKPGRLPPLRLHMMELNEVSGTVLTSMLTVTGFPSTVKTVPGPLKKDTTTVATPVRVRADSAKVTTGGGGPRTPSPAGVHIASLAPGEASPGSNAVIRGTGFTPTGNTVMFGRVEIRDLPSSDGGTVIRFTVPMEVPATGEVPPKRIGAGEFTVIVRNARGASNTVRFVVQD